MIPRLPSWVKKSPMSEDSPQDGSAPKLLATAVEPSEPHPADEGSASTRGSSTRGRVYLYYEATQKYEPFEDAGDVFKSMNHQVNELKEQLSAAEAALAASRVSHVAQEKFSFLEISNNVLQAEVAQLRETLQIREEEVARCQKTIESLESELSQQKGVAAGRASETNEWGNR